MNMKPAAQVFSTSAEPSTVTSLRERNRARVLRQIILARETTRAEIARDSGLSAASAINIVSELIADGLVEEKGSISSRGGRPIAILSPRGDSAITIGADIGERGVAVEMFDLAMNRVDREFSGGRQLESAAQIGADLTAALAALRERNPDRWPNLLGIGLGLPGIVETDDAGKQTLYAQSLGWDPVAITELCDVGAIVHAENGAKTQARAELWYGAARGVGHALVVLLGRGVGLGVVAEGKLTHGSRSSAGEWGHTIIEHNGRLCRCGNRGCIEAYVGSDAILGAWAERGGKFDGSGWGALGELLGSAERGAPVAAAVVEETVDYLSVGLGVLVNLYNPERIVIGGWVGLRLMESLAVRIHEAVKRVCLDRPGGQFDLAAAELGGDSVSLGAALLPIEALIGRNP